MTSPSTNSGAMLSPRTISANGSAPLQSAAAAGEPAMIGIDLRPDMGSDHGHEGSLGRHAGSGEYRGRGLDERPRAGDVDITVGERERGGERRDERTRTIAGIAGRMRSVAEIVKGRRPCAALVGEIRS